MTGTRTELPDGLVADYEQPDDLHGEAGRFERLKKALLERALGAELSEHLGYEKDDPAGRGTDNSRKGHSGKTVLGADGAMTMVVEGYRQPRSNEKSPGRSQQFIEQSARTARRHSRVTGEALTCGDGYANS